jgi:pimeloyl-ACP methyl ester carboxylesterase
MRLLRPLEWVDSRGRIVGMGRPRLLLVPGISELEWQIKPQLEDWADVATYDPPGVGQGPGEWSIEASVDRGLRELDERGWDDYVLVADGWGSAYGVGILEARPAALRGFALGHAALSARMTGERAPLNGAVWDALSMLIEQGREPFARFAIPQFTRDGYDEALATEMLERIPIPVLEAMLAAGKSVDYDLEALLRPLNLPLLFAKHEDCLLFTDEGYEDAVKAFPEARTCAMKKVCSVNPVFADALREFCEEIYA